MTPDEYAEAARAALDDYDVRLKNWITQKSIVMAMTVFSGIKIVTIQDYLLAVN
ncbi:hypothetical protein KCP77_10275 [Salmonella enterica subsp. enterica]|nr:hypothetical protein KCP77_10275 [Salmonella enterica subsp. enterica]